MNQIILPGGIVLPQTSRDKYRCYEGNLSVRLEMISGRMVEEIRGRVYYAEYAYDYMGNDLMRRVLAVLRAGGAFEAAVLPDHQDTMISSQFICTELSQPTFAFSKRGQPYWHNFSFKMREVRPHG